MKSEFAFFFTFLLLLFCLSSTRGNGSETAASSIYSVHNLNTGLDYPTIQEAINANETLNGQTILVDSGTFYEHITVNKSLSLVGANKETTIIDGNHAGTVIQLETGISNVSICNFTVRNAGLNTSGAYSLVNACIAGWNAQNIDVEDNVFLNAGRCIVFGSSSLINISNNDISNSASYAVDVGGPSSTNVTLSDNLIHDYGTFGISVDGDARYCRIMNNTVENGQSGIGLFPNMNTLFFPRDNLIEGNTFSNNSVTNVWVWGSGSNPAQVYYTNTFRRNNMTNSQHYNLIVWGDNLPSFMQDIDSSNTANGKKIYYLVNMSNVEIDPANCPDAGYLALVNSTNVTVKDFAFTYNKDGLLLAGSANCTLTNMTVANNRLHAVAMNVSLPSYWGGLTFFESGYNTVEDCQICNDSYGVGLCYSNWNLFCHNAFVSNDKNVISDYYDPFENNSLAYVSTNIWDNGVEGNYWSDYNGTDANHDGVGDAPYVLDASNTDHCPLMGVYSSYNTSLGCSVGVVSNSTVESFDYFGSNSTISLRVSNMTANQTFGFCRLCIPHDLMNASSISVTIDDGTTLVLYPNYTLFDNGTHRWIYLAYPHSTHEIAVTPEFSSLLVLPTFMISALLAAMLCRRKGTKRQR